MLRAIGGLFAASLVAPYLASFLITLFLAIFDHVSRNDALLARPSPVDELLGVLNVPFLGTIGLAMFGLPILLVAAIVALALDIFGLRSKRHSVIGGGGLGGLFLGLLFSGSWIPLVAGLLTGAVCGWIYWRIALHRPSPSASRTYQEIR
jgi:small-conductance mechanosensitive channel